jgi:hypothetical protein
MDSDPVRCIGSVVDSAFWARITTLRVQQTTAEVA